MPLRRIALCALLVLTACATSYHAVDLSGGYSEARLDTNVFRITFAGSLGSKREAVDEMALLRSAEVALRHGFPYFTSSGPAATGSAVSLATNVVSVPATTITIAGYPTPPEVDGLVYDAERLVSQLGPKYRD